MSVRKLVVSTVAVLLLMSAFLGNEARAQEPPGGGGGKFDKSSVGKIGTQLTELMTQGLGALAQGSGPDVVSRPPIMVHGKLVVVDLAASGDIDDLVSDLEGLGAQGITIYGNSVSAQVPIDSLDDLNGLASLRLARASAATTNVGLTDSQGDAAMRSDDARVTFGVDGTGIMVGALSDSFDDLGGAAADVASGDLPAGIAVLADLGGGGTDEGRGMMQLIHDVAPGADQAFHTAFVGQADFALGIEELAGCPPGSAAGCTPVPGVAADVITDDVIFFAEPMFQDGILAQAVDNVKAAGLRAFFMTSTQALVSIPAWTSHCQLERQSSRSSGRSLSSLSVERRAQPVIWT